MLWRSNTGDRKIRLGASAIAQTLLHYITHARALPESL